MQATEEDLAKFAHIKDAGRRTYAAMVMALDHGIGRIIQKLKVEGTYENTLIVFLSDNGGATINSSWNGPLAGCKGNCLEGGIRVPLIWQWPGMVPAGQPSDAVVSSLDILPTFLAAANAEYKPQMDKTGLSKLAIVYDGINILPILKGEEEGGPRRLFWRLQGQAAILDGEDKLIRLSHRPAQYFRPVDDIGERNDLAGSKKERYEELYKMLSEWETLLPTRPHFSTSHFWQGQSAKNYDSWLPRVEPK